MDRFKFRVWDKEKSEWLREDYIFIRDNGDLAFEYQDYDCSIVYLKDELFTVEQCTGLKDKNGKLIYEGDIVNFKYDYSNETYQCSETDVNIVVNFQKCWFYPFNEINSNDCKVIGNIHQNKDLLDD